LEKQNNGFKEKYSNFKKKAAGFLEKRGFYFVLLVCLALTGIAAALTLGPKNKQEEPSSTPGYVETRLSGDESLAMITPSPSPKATPSPTLEPTVIPDFTIAPTKEPKQQPSKAAAPVDGKVIFSFAADKLLYSRTLKQWMTHPGVDIASKVGSEVRAVLPGKVTSVYEDDRFGVTVVIEHSEKRETVYANLKQKPPVEKGDKLDAGDIVGLIGETAISECGDEPHLHFEFRVNDEAVDPSEYVLFVHKDE
jgi:murein DD-endopeptidase MepM/ murein hydrolase activator NlpD